jgi:hypothetical protein
MDRKLIEKRLTKAMAKAIVDSLFDEVGVDVVFQNAEMAINLEKERLIAEIKREQKHGKEA